MASATGRQRGIRKQLSSEDQALNMIAKEAEARLAAKRAARAEARSIRMKELERKQKEIDDLENDEIDTTRRKSTSRLSSPGSASSPLGSDLNLSVSSDVSFLKESLKETEEKYRKAMVNAAQLDNERQALLYQVECLKDVIEDLEENITNAKDELHDKTKEYNKLSRDHENTTEKLDKCSYLLSERERILDEHGINLDGTLKESDEPDGNDEQSAQNPSYMHNHFDASQENEEKQQLLAEIESLRNEVEDLRSQQETTGSRKQSEHARTVEQRADFERSFVDVSSEAAAIRDDATHTGLYVNNNEKCDEFEVIDDNSQQGGIRNFEDKSFERSGRSSMLSSVRTDLVSDSVESEVPLEISVDASNNNNKQDDYDIVQFNEHKKGTALDINALAAGSSERSASPFPESNININKYLFSDNDEDENEEPETSGTFNIDMYFATEEKSSSTLNETEDRIKEIDESDKELDELKDDANDVHDTSPEIVADVEDERSVNVVDEETDAHSSPFLEVKSQVNDDASVNNETVLPTVDARRDADPSFDRNVSSDENDEMNKAFVSSEEIENVGEVSSRQEVSVVEQNDSTEPLKEEVAKTNTLGVNVDHDIRKSVEDLYDKILSEGSSDASNDLLDSSNTSDLPPDATFGEPISITAKVEETNNASPTELVTKKKEGWLVRVESFSTPGTRTPEIKVIGDDGADKEEIASPTEVAENSKETTDSPTPVPKERKKKKKKKNKNKKSVDVVETEDVEEIDNEEENTPTTTAIESDSATSSPAVSPTKKLNHSDIPKQFLDASNTLAGDSYSDTSDIEHEVSEEGGATVNKKRGGSKKKNKESCKTQ